jgi:hypothetical protein
MYNVLQAHVFSKRRLIFAWTRNEFLSRFSEI